MQQNPAMMQQIPARFEKQIVDSYIRVQIRNILNTKYPSTTDLSSTGNLSQEAAALFLKRAKNAKIADKNCLKLTTEIVQGVVNKIADGADKLSSRFLRGETTTAEQGRTYAVKTIAATQLGATSTLCSYDTLMT